MKIGFVYLLMEVDAFGNERYKIGITKRNVAKRILELQTGNSNKISLLDIYETINYKKLEQMLHLRFSNNRTESMNEWFNLSDEDILNFKNTCEKINNTIEFMKKENPFF